MYLFKCVKVHGKTEHQHMAELPAERLVAGCNTFHLRRRGCFFRPMGGGLTHNRGRHAISIRWAVMCMCTRAVHIEVIESLSASCFINALRRLFSIRGLAKQIRSDCGTNSTFGARNLLIGSTSAKYCVYATNKNLFDLVATKLTNQINNCRAFSAF